MKKKKSPFINDIYDLAKNNMDLVISKLIYIHFITICDQFEIRDTCNFSRRV